jgi:hypothetical protein
VLKKHKDKFSKITILLLSKEVREVGSVTNILKMRSNMGIGWAI